jgi:hypothetical protein
MGSAGGHIQSLIFGTAALVGALICLALVVIADLLRTNRVLLEENLERVKSLQYSDREVAAKIAAVQEAATVEAAERDQELREAQLRDQVAKDGLDER